MAECLFYRLLVTVDDFGRFDARPAMVKSNCFPIKESVTAKHCTSLLAELEKSGLLVVYEVEGKPYLQLCKWDNAPRSKESKYPAIPAVADVPRTSVCSPSTVLPGTGTGTGNREPEQKPEPLVGAEKSTEAAVTTVAVAPATTRGSRLPADWLLPKAWGDWAANEYPQWSADKVRTEGAKFADHWHAKAGKDAAKADWQATWRSWCRSDIAHRDDPKQGRPSTAQRDAEVRRLLGASSLNETTEVFDA